MKTNLILVSLHSASWNARNLNKICGHYKPDFETRQIAVYTIADGLATIHSLTPTIATRLNLPLPLTLPITDLGSGQLQRIDIEVDTLTVYPATCPTLAWATRRSMQPAPTVEQVLMADYIGLL